MKVKSSRKIWSIPIAALALVLMLVGALAVSGIVQAQTPGDRDISVTPEDGVAEIGEAEAQEFVFAMSELTSTGGVATIIIPDAVEDNIGTTEVDETVNGLIMGEGTRGEAGFVPDEGVSEPATANDDTTDGYELTGADARYFTVSAVMAQSPW